TPSLRCKNCQRREAIMSNQRKESLSETGPTGNLRPPQSIAAQVRDALRANGYVDDSGIRVDVNDSGMLTLTGTVPSDEQKQLSEVCGGSVRGITAVIN